MIGAFATVSTSCNATLVILGGSYWIQGYKGVPQQDPNRWELNDIKAGAIPVDQVTWSLTKDIQYLHIMNGVIYWDKDIAIGQYNFFVQAEYNGMSVRTKKLVQLNILSEFKIDGGSKLITMNTNESYTDLESWGLYEINNQGERKEITSSTIWSVYAAGPQAIELDGHVSINNENKLAVSSGIKSDNYKFQLQVKYITNDQTLHIYSDWIYLVVNA